MKRTFLLIISLLALSPGGLRADEEKLIQPLELAVELASRIEGDSDVRGEMLLKVSGEAADMGMFDIAEQADAILDDHRRAIATARLVRAASLESDDPSALLEVLHQAERFVQRGNPLAVDRARMEVGLAFGACGEWKKAEQEWFKAINDRETAATASLRMKVMKAEKEGGFDLKAAIQDVKAAAKDGPFPGAVTAAEELLDVAMRKHDGAGSISERKESIKLAQSALDLASVAQVDVTALQFEAANRLFRAGAETESRLVFEQAMSALKRMPDGYELKARLHADWARLWIARGRKTEVPAILERGRALAGQRLEAMHRPGVLAALAAAAHDSGEAGLFEDLMDQALKEAEQNPNARVRLIAGVEICIAHAVSGKAVAEDLSRRLRGLVSQPDSVGDS